MYLFAIIKQQKFAIRFNTLKQLKKQISDKNPSLEFRKISRSQWQK